MPVLFHYRKATCFTGFRKKTSTTPAVSCVFLEAHSFCSCVSQVLQLLHQRPSLCYCTSVQLVCSSSSQLEEEGWETAMTGRLTP